MEQNYTQSVVTDTGKNHVVANGTKDVTYHILATIPLKIIHDLFKKLHLTKGMYMRMVLNLNTQCSTTCVLAPNAGTAANIEYTSFTTTSLNGVLPFMLSPTGTGNGFLATGVTGVKATLGNATTSYPQHYDKLQILRPCVRDDPYSGRNVFIRSSIQEDFIQ